MSKHKTYNINPAKIGNQKGFRLPNAFYQDNPQFTDASGQIEVINDETLLIHLDTKNEVEEENEESLMMSLFLDFLLDFLFEFCNMLYTDCLLIGQHDAHDRHGKKPRLFLQQI